MHTLTYNTLINNTYACAHLYGYVHTVLQYNFVTRFTNTETATVQKVTLTDILLHKDNHRHVA